MRRTLPLLAALALAGCFGPDESMGPGIARQPPASPLGPGSATQPAHDDFEAARERPRAGEDVPAGEDALLPGTDRTGRSGVP